MDTFDAINRRRSVKAYDPIHRLTTTEETKLLEAAIDLPPLSSTPPDVSLFVTKCLTWVDGDRKSWGYTGGFDWLAVDGIHLASLGSGQWAYGSLTLTEVWTSTTMSLTVTGATAVPEIAPNSLGSVVALVLGSLGLLERRRLQAA